MKKFKTIQILVTTLFLCIINTNLLAKEHQFADLTILVSSCDKYSPFWEPFFISLYKNWPSLQNHNKNIPILLVSNKNSYPDPRITTINIYPETSWSNNMLEALSKVQTKYVMILLDDYWLNEPVDERRLQEVYQGLRLENAAMVHISSNDPRYQTGIKHLSLPNVMYTNKFALYKASLQLSIWDKNALLTLLKPGEDPWTFEIAGSARSHGYPAAFLCLSADEPIKYINASHQGHVNPAAIAHATKYNIPFNYDGFPVLGKYNYKLTYSLWKKRLQRVKAFIKNPGFVYNFG